MDNVLALSIVIDLAKGYSVTQVMDIHNIYLSDIEIAINKVQQLRLTYARALYPFPGEQTALEVPETD